MRYLLTFLAILSLSPTTAATFDLSTPENALAEFKKAMVAGDWGSLQAVSLIAPSRREAFEAICETIAATNELRNDASTRWPKDGALTIDKFITPTDRSGRLARAAVDEDTVRFLDPLKPDSPVLVKRVAGEWKIDLSEDIEEEHALRQAQQIAMTRRVTGILKTLASEVRAGKIQSQDTFAARLREELTKATSTTRPTTQQSR